MSDMTPMRQQYMQIKEQNQDCILFFRLGDFYEMFDEDAKLASKELDLTLTTRDRSKDKPEDRVPMCGVPYHSSEAYIARLIARGYKVAICEQVEDPALAKGLVSREVTRIVTPGTLIDSSMLDEGRNNYICSIYLDQEALGVCFCDISTGQLFVTSFQGEQRLIHLKNELSRYWPKEAVLSDHAFSNMDLTVFLQHTLFCRVEPGKKDFYSQDTARQWAEQHFNQENLAALPASAQGALQAVGGLLFYLHQTQKTDLSHLRTLQYYLTGQFMELDLHTRRNLELTEALGTREKRDSLLWVLDHTKTPMGRRLIRSWLEQPLLNPIHINRRLNAVKQLTENAIVREELALALKEIGDLERLMSRVSYGTANGRDLVALVSGLRQIPRLRALFAPLSSALLSEIEADLDERPDLCALIDRALTDSPPFSVREGGMIRDGYHSDVDYLRNILQNGHAMVAAVEAQEREKSGIRNLKIGYNKVFGYYIEISKSNYDLIPEHYIRKQTLANCERFITQELKDLEHTILSARDKLSALEYDLFNEVRQTAALEVGRIQKTAAAAAQTDVLTSFAVTAARGDYTMPQVDDSGRLEIVSGRHPVVEKTLQGNLFVPNDTLMDGSNHVLAIITGPNMAGKSTYMRQVALIVLMAQVGSFVPAQSAHIGVVDRIFTRIGAFDNLAGGQSTFMVEMAEVADILKNATRKSLLILDEIGRGTSTYDGMSIARAVLEHCANFRHLGAKTLFSTHYHELTVLEGQIPGVKNYNLAAKKRGDNIIFLRKIISGGADKSYGVEVAKLAGIPDRIISRAKELLAVHEGGSAPPPSAQVSLAEQDQLSLQSMSATRIAERLKTLDINTLTPIEALGMLFEFKQLL